MSVSLLDVNVLVALAWPSHVHHRQAHAWFAANQSAGWATCPLTQCGFVRVSSNPRVIPEAVQPNEAVELLRQMTALKAHEFWSDDVSFTDDLIPSGLLVGHRQVTDSYLLGLCIHRKGKLVTLDQTIESLLGPGSPHRQSLQVISSDMD